MREIPNNCIQLPFLVNVFFFDNANAWICIHTCSHAHSKHTHMCTCMHVGALPWSSSSVLDHRSLPPVFESRRGHIWRLFRLSLRLITFGSRSAHLAYLVHKVAVKHQSSSPICMLSLKHTHTFHHTCMTVLMYTKKCKVSKNDSKTGKFCTLKMLCFWKVVNFIRYTYVM